MAWWFIVHLAKPGILTQLLLLATDVAVDLVGRDAEDLGNLTGFVSVGVHLHTLSIRLVHSRYVTAPRCGLEMRVDRLLNVVI